MTRATIAFARAITAYNLVCLVLAGWLGSA